jgi:hypothetical protein
VKKMKLWVSMLIVVGGAVLLIAFSVRAVGQEQDVTQDELGRRRATGVVTSAFAYQGVLEEDGQPVTGNRQMVFRLTSDDGCTTQVGSSVTRNVSVSDGLFSVDLSFDATAFDGRALWLETEVEGNVIGCQPIQTVPYANSVRPGAIISGSVGSEAQLLHVRSGTALPDEGVLGAKLGLRTSLGYPVGVYGYARDFGSVGVWGESDSEFGWGVNGVAEGTSSIGVRGIAEAFTSTTYGVYGEAASADGYGGYFLNTAVSNGGWALAANGRHGAVITSTGGSALVANGSGDSAIGDDGVRGEHTGDGVVGSSSSTGNLDNGVVGFSAGGYGVYGFSNGTGQFGAYFNDPIFVNGGCTGCTMSYVARNTSGTPLRVGDLARAEGVEVSAAGGQQPIMQVARARSGDRVVGVVLGRTELTMAEPGADDVQPGPHYGPISGDAEPGDYLVVVVQGLAQVRVDPTAGIETGDLMAAGADGARQAVDTSSFGTVLGKAESEGVVWVLVGFN